MKKLFFRFHQETLADSMATKIEVISKDFLMHYIKKNFNIPIENVRIQQYCYDDRIGWDAYIVTGRIYALNWETVIGFLSGAPHWDEDMSIR